MKEQMKTFNIEFLSINTENLSLSLTLHYHVQKHKYRIRLHCFLKSGSMINTYIHFHGFQPLLFKLLWSTMHAQYRKYGRWWRRLTQIRWAGWWNICTVYLKSMHPLRYGMVCVCVCLCVPWHTGEFEFEYTCMHFLLVRVIFIIGLSSIDWLLSMRQ